MDVKVTDGGILTATGEALSDAEEPLPNAPLVLSPQAHATKLWGLSLAVLGEPWYPVGRAAARATPAI